MNADCSSCGYAYYLGARQVSRRSSAFIQRMQPLYGGERGQDTMWVGPSKVRVVTVNHGEFDPRRGEGYSTDVRRVPPIFLPSRGLSRSTRVRTNCAPISRPCGRTRRSAVSWPSSCRPRSTSSTPRCAERAIRASFHVTTRWRFRVKRKLATIEKVLSYHSMPVDIPPMIGVFCGTRFRLLYSGSVSGQGAKSLPVVVTSITLRYQTG